MVLKAGIADDAGDGAEGDSAWLEFDFEGLADALATPVNGGDACFTRVVDEHDGLLDRFALAIVVSLVREIFFLTADECASVLVPTEEGLSQRRRLPSFRIGFAVDEL